MKARKKTGKAKAPSVHLPRASARLRRTVMRDVGNVLKSHGVAGRVAELHLAGFSAEDGNCPNGQTKHVVCKKQADGSVVCTEECS